VLIALAVLRRRRTFWRAAAGDDGCVRRDRVLDLSC
jgi:hypothetical protein